LENLNGDENVKRAWENIKENIKTSAENGLVLNKWKHHIPWFDKNVYISYIIGSRLECSGYKIQAEAM